MTVKSDKPWKTITLFLAVALGVVLIFTGLIVVAPSPHKDWAPVFRG